MRAIRRHRAAPATTGRGHRPARQQLALVERVSARAGPAGVGVVDREALLLDRVDEVDGGAGEVGPAHAVDDDLDTAEIGELVTVEAALVEEQLVTKPGA